MTGAANPKSVMVIYGHDKEANDALFDWLRAIGLRPREWRQLVSASGIASPYVGQVLDRAFEQAQAVVAFFTPDEHVIASGVAEGEKVWRLQARPNVLIEAGMALVTHPERMVLVVLGTQELPSDLSGRHYIRLRHNDPLPLHDLAGRLAQAGCDTDLTGADWLRPDRFPDRDNAPDLQPEGAGGPVSSRPRPQAAPGTAPSPRAPQYRLLHTLTGHEGQVFRAVFSPDGMMIATACQDRNVRIWRTSSLDRGRYLPRQMDAVLGAAFSPDGKILATTNADRTVYLWRARTGDALRRMAGHSATITGLAFSPDGALLATVSRDRTARIWDVATGECVRSLTGHTAALNGVAFSPDGTLLATAGEDRSARLWDVATGGLAKTYEHAAQVAAVAFSPDGAWLAAAGKDGMVWLSELERDAETSPLSGHIGAVHAVAFSPDGALLATGGADKSVRIWDLVTDTCVQALTAHTGKVWSVAFSPDGTLIATASGDKTARIWSGS